MNDQLHCDGGGPGSSVFERIDVVRNPVVRRLRDVLRSKAEKPGAIIIDDEENIRQACSRGVSIHSLYLSGNQVVIANRILSDFALDVPCYVLADSVAEHLFGGEKRARVFALGLKPPVHTLAHLVDRSGDLLILDGVRLTGNIGAIIRNAHAFGAAGIILLDSGLVSIYDRRLVRASRGLVFALPIVIASREDTRAFLARHDIPIAILSPAESHSLASVHAVPDRLAIVLGGERRGVSADMEAIASYRYAIPMAEDVESLNVSAAAAIALYERRSMATE